jgi:hypothetical protein
MLIGENPRFAENSPTRHDTRWCGTDGLNVTVITWRDRGANVPVNRI